MLWTKPLPLLDDSETCCTRSLGRSPDSPQQDGAPAAQALFIGLYQNLPCLTSPLTVFLGTPSQINYLHPNSCPRSALGGT